MEGNVMANTVETLLNAFGAGSATWDETMEALRGLTDEDWGLSEKEEDPDTPTQGDPDWWQSVEDRAFGGPPSTDGITALDRARRQNVITEEQWEQAYILISQDEE